MTLTAVLIDDEPLAREIIRDYCRLYGQIEIRAEFESILKAKDWFETNHCDVLFLDIQMPRITGIDWLRSSPNIQNCAIILTTAHSEFVSDSYELNVHDYLLKPVSYERFSSSIKRLQIPENNESISSSKRHIFKVDKALIPVSENDIECVQAMGDYIKIFTKEKNLVVRQTLKNILTQFSSTLFLQPHKSWIVNKQYIRKIEGNLVFLDQHEIPISDFYKDLFLSRL